MLFSSSSVWKRPRAMRNRSQGGQAMFYFWRMLYEVMITLVVLTYAIIIFADPNDHPFLTRELVHEIDMGLIFFFVLEYAFRFGRAQNKAHFVRTHWLDLIAMIPLDSHFLLVRILRIVRLVRIMRESPLLWSLVTSNEMRFIFLFISVVIFWASTGFYLLEAEINPSIHTFGDAVWWSLVTTTTVGYGDISPVTQAGRAIATFLMITGIGLISTLTANLANHSISFFDGMKLRYKLQAAANREEEDEEPSDNRLHLQLKENVLHQVQHVETLSESEYRTLLKMLTMLRENKS
jgi:voltage-gated potassium channel